MVYGGEATGWLVMVFFGLSGAVSVTRLLSKNNYLVGCPGRIHRSSATALALDRAQQRQVAEGGRRKEDRHRLDGDERGAKRDAGKSVFLPDFARGCKESGGGGGDDQQLDDPEEGDSTNLEHLGADGHQLQRPLGTVERGGQRVCRLTPQQQATPEQGLPDLHSRTTRRLCEVASSARLRFVLFSIRPPGLSASSGVPNLEVTT